ncbi:MAG: hypothetical protein WD795_20870 [Woeseia sp.]
MIDTQFAPFLRRVLMFDAATCVLTGIVLLALAAALEQMLAIPAAVSRVAAVVLLVFAAGVGYVSTRDPLLRPAVTVIVAMNVLWAVASVLALVFAWLMPNRLGQAFVIAQALAVAIIAGLQIAGLRRGVRVAI